MNTENQNSNPEEITEQAPAEINNQITDEAVLSYFKEKGREVNSLDDLFSVPDPVIETKEVNPWEDVIDDDDRAYLNYKKETGRSRKDFESLQINIEDISPLDFAREQVLNESGLKLDHSQIDEYLEDKLGISDITELSTKDLIELSRYGKSVKESRLESQNKYKQPIQTTPEVPQKQNTNQDEYVSLANGTYMKKSDFEQAQQNQQKHNEMVKEAVNSVTAASFKVFVDDNGEQKELNYSYDYSDNDKSSAVSMVSDLGKHVQESYQTEKGFNHAQFAEDVFWLDPKNREVAIASVINKARAEAIEEVLKHRGNVNFNSQNKNLSNTDKPGVKYVGINDI